MNAKVGTLNAQGLPSRVTITGQASPATLAASAAADAATLATHNTSATTHAIAVAAAVAVLVADGATPTQAHVNTLNTAYGLLATDLTNISADSAALTADTAAISGSGTGDVTLSFNTTTVKNRSALKFVMDALQQRVLGSSHLTP